VNQPPRKRDPQPPPTRTREAAFTSAAVALIGTGLFVQTGWPLLIGGFVLLVMAVALPS
jgi:hypothetical protein